MQEEIAWQISEALRLKLTGEQKKKLRKRPTVNPEAYQEYLRGRYHWNNFSPDSLRRAREHFERAVELDPTYALAYAGLGDAFGAMAYYGYIAPAEGFPRAAAAARRAHRARSAMLADAHVTLGIERLFWGWDWAAAERELQTAISAEPEAGARAFGARLDRVGRAAATRRRCEQRCTRANWIRCRSSSMSASPGSHHFAGRPEDAIREALKAREIVPGFEEAGNVLISSYEALGPIRRSRGE